MLVISKEDATEQVAEFSKQEVIELILKMLKFNQREQALVTYARENEAHPEWNLKAEIKAAMEKP